MENKRLKVVWICHFSNSEIRAKLGIKKDIQETAPWVSSSINLFKNRSDINLYIISPYSGLKKDKEFVLDGINYKFLNTGMPILGRNWPSFFRWDYLSNFKSTRIKIVRKVKEINPDIVNLIGAENAYYSTSILDIKDDYPTVITIQGFIHLSQKLLKNKQIIKRSKIEKEILRTCNNFIYQITHTKEIINKLNKGAQLFQNYLPHSIKIGDISNNHKNYNYDFVFFAQVAKGKGIEDLVKALAIVKKRHENVKMAVLGACNSDYLLYLKNLAKENGLASSIDWLGFLPTQADVHKIVTQSKVTVLPTYNDIISGTIIESMYLKTPVIAYRTGGIPDLNLEQEVIRLVDQKNIEELSISMDELMSDFNCRKLLAERAFAKVNDLFDNDKIPEKLKEIYSSVIKDFKNGN